MGAVSAGLAQGGAVGQIFPTVERGECKVFRQCWEATVTRVSAETPNKMTFGLVLSTSLVTLTHLVIGTKLACVPPGAIISKGLVS